MLERLNRHEQRCLMELLVYLTRADHTVMEAKREMLREYSELLEVELDSLDKTLTPEEVVPQFQSPASRVIVLQELFRLARLDGNFTIIEQSVLLDIASMMGFPMELVQKIENWVVDGLEWTLRGEDLLDEAAHTILRKA